MTYSGNTIGVWGRDVTWTKESILPATVSVLGEELLAGPMALTIETEGKTSCLAPGELVLKSREPHRAEISASGQVVAGLSYTADLWMEYDGLVWCKVVMRPARPVAVQALRVEIPIQPEHARYFHNSCRHDSDRAGAVSAIAGAKRFPFAYPSFYVCSMQRGISLTFQSMQGWRVEKENVWEIRRTPDAVLLVLHMIDSPSDISGPTEYSFGLQAMPIKPLPPDWHSWWMEECPGSRRGWFARAQELDVALVFDTRGYGRPRIMRTLCDPMGANYETQRFYTNMCHENGTLAVPYLAPCAVDDTNPVHLLFVNEWRRAPGRKWKHRDLTTKNIDVMTGVCQHSSYQDFLVYAINQMIEKGGIDGMYFDGYTPGACSNRRHGCGWVDDRGRSRPTWPILAYRRFYRRLATLLARSAERKGFAPTAGRFRQPWPNYAIWCHSSSVGPVPSMAFVTHGFRGEQYREKLRHGKRYPELLTLDQFRAEYPMAATGIHEVFLGYDFDYYRSRKTDTLSSAGTQAILSYTLPHGLGTYPHDLNPSYAGKVLDAQVAFGTRTASFFPCWAADIPISAEPERERTLVACWVSVAGDMLAVVSNVGNGPEPVTLTSEKALAAAEDVIRGDEIPVRNGRSLTVDVDAHAIRLLLLRTPSGK